MPGRHRERSRPSGREPHRIFTVPPHRYRRPTPIVKPVTSGGSGTRRVLVVDDEPTIAASVAARLRAEGFLVDVAHDGPGAVALAAASEPDLVVLDVMLPGFDGLEVCRRVQAARPIPVLMLTARDSE